MFMRIFYNPRNFKTFIFFEGFFCILYHILSSFLNFQYTYIFVFSWKNYSVKLIYLLLLINLLILSFRPNLSHYIYMLPNEHPVEMNLLQMVENTVIHSIEYVAPVIEINVDKYLNFAQIPISNFIETAITKWIHIFNGFSNGIKLIVGNMC